MGFVLVFLLVEITDKIKYYFEYNPSGGLMLKYFLVKMPGYLFFAIPLSILVGGMLSLLTLAKNSEIIALQANGVDALNIARPVVVIGFASSLIMFVADETLIPWSNSYSEYIQNVEIAKKADTTYVREGEIWIRSADSTIHIKKYDKSDNTLENVEVVRWDADYDFTEKIFAEKAKWWKDHWELYGAGRIFKTPDGKFHIERTPSMMGPFNKPPWEFEVVEKPAKEMNLIQLSAHIEKLKAEGRLPGRYLVDWHAKIAFPFVCLIMAGLSVPFAIKVNPRGGGVAIGLGLSLLVAFSYWILNTMFIALGHGGYIPPIAAAWAGNFIFGLTAGILLLQAGT